MSIEVQDGPEPIYSASRRCLALFDKHFSQASAWDEPNTEVEELRSQFIRWAAYAGAFALPKACLDARLSMHTDIKNMILDLLDILELNLDWGTCAYLLIDVHRSP